MKKILIVIGALLIIAVLGIVFLTMPTDNDKITIVPDYCQVKPPYSVKYWQELHPECKGK